MKNKTKRKHAPGGGRPRLAIHRDAVIQLRVRAEEKAALAAAAADAGISLTEFILFPALARARGQHDVGSRLPISEGKQRGSGAETARPFATGRLPGQRDV